MGLGGGSFDVGYQVAPVLLLLETSEHHLRPWDVLLGVLQVDVQGFIIPGDALADVGVSVGEAGSSPGLPADHPVQVGAWGGGWRRVGVCTHPACACRRPPRCGTGRTP